MLSKGILEIVLFRTITIYFFQGKDGSTRRSDKWWTEWE